MYHYLLLLHSLFRWLVLCGLLLALYRSISGLLLHRSFTATDNRVRHVTATLAHVQLAIGYLLYFNSPFIRFFRQHYAEARSQFDYVFFGIVHIALMTLAVVMVTAGASLAKRKETASARFRIMLLWMGLALFVILIAIPWPFSPLARRPYFRLL